MTIRAAADGSALGNPGPAGWAWYVDPGCWGAGGWKHATNNQGELMAVLQLFRSTAHLPDDLLILCDSQYVINCVTKWMPGWKKKGWRKADGKAVLNVDLLKEIDAALVGRRYRFEWVKGHANHPLNEAADVRARTAAEAYQRALPIPTGPGWVRLGDPPAGRATASAVVAVEPRPPAVAVASAVRLATAAAASELTLFAWNEEDEDDATVAITVTLTHRQLDQLRQRARVSGVTVEEALASLVG